MVVHTQISWVRKICLEKHGFKNNSNLLFIALVNDYVKKKTIINIILSDEINKIIIMYEFYLITLFSLRFRF